MTASSPVRLHTARVAVTTRHHGADDPRTVDARRDLASAQLEQFIAHTVAAAPPLTAEQRDRLALLLRSGSTTPARLSTHPAA